MNRPLPTHSADSTRSRRPISPEALALRRLARDGVDLVSWPRSLPPGLGAHLAAWARGEPRYFDEIVSPRAYDLSPATEGIAEAARAWITADVAMLVARLAQVADARRVRVSFGVVRTDQCRKFHVDFVRYRLVTTYVGPGTEWLPESAVSREALQHPADCPCDANREIVRDAAAVRHAGVGEVILMKGALHPGSPGAVHRSPPIEASGRSRVVLIASTAEAP